MQNSMVGFTITVLDQKYHFWTNLVKNNQDCQFKLIFDT